MPVQLQEGRVCPSCQRGKLRLPNNGQDSYFKCSECGAIELNYIPLPHQAKFHADPHRFKMFAGGFGSGKTHTGAMETIRHILSTPKGMTLIGAQTKPQLDQTAKKMFFDLFPRELIQDYNKAKEELTVKNGHTVLFRPLDDEGKIRSLNLSFFWIEEASEVKYDIFVQLQTRLRNKATKHHQGILTTNPDMGWIRTEFLLKSDKIYNAQVPYYQNKEEINPSFSTHIAPTALNPYLPDGYIDTLRRSKPEWWVKRYLEGSFEYTEGQVFPNFHKCIIEPVEIKPYWERVFGVDFGLRAPTAVIAGAIDPKLGELHIYREHYEAGQPVHYHAAKIKDMMKDAPPGMVRFIVADPSGKQRNKNDLRSTFDHYAEYGIFFREGSNKIEDSIVKLYGYFEMGKIKIHSNCVNLIRELTNYKYKEQSLHLERNPDEKPVDKDNHAIDALRYIIMELPDDPDQLVNYSVGYNYFIQKEKHLPWALRSNQDEVMQSVDWYNWY